MVSQAEFKESTMNTLLECMGPYDQNRHLKLKIQLPGSNLNFKDYTECQHEGDVCFIMELKSSENYEDLEKNRRIQNSL